MANKKPDAAQNQADNTDVTSTKRKRAYDQSPDPDPDPDLAPKQRRTENLNGYRLSLAAYGRYIKDNKSPLDFATFLDALPEEILVQSWTYAEFASFALTWIRATETKIKLDISKLSTAEKSSKIKQAVDCINGVLPDVQHTCPEQASDLASITDKVYLSTKKSVADCGSVLQQHTSTMKGKLATAQALQDSLDANEKMFMKKVIDSLKEKVERVEKLGQLFGGEGVE